MNFQLSIDAEHMALLKSEAMRMNIPMASYVKMKVFENLKINAQPGSLPAKSEILADNPPLKNDEC